MITFRIEEILNSLSPNLERPVCLSCVDNTFSLGDGAILYMVSDVRNGGFWASLDKPIAKDGVSLRVKLYKSTRLRHYRIDDERVSNRELFLKLTQDGFVRVVDERGEYVSGDDLSGIYLMKSKTVYLPILTSRA